MSKILPLVRSARSISPFLEVDLWLSCTGKEWWGILSIVSSIVNNTLTMTFVCNTPKYGRILSPWRTFFGHHTKIFKRSLNEISKRHAIIQKIRQKNGKHYWQPHQIKKFGCSDSLDECTRFSLPLFLLVAANESDKLPMHSQCIRPSIWPRMMVLLHHLILMVIS